MNRINLIVLSAFLAAAAGSATAQGSSDRAEQLRQSAEWNRPLEIGFRNASPTATQAAADDAERRAEAFRRDTEMMRPQSLGAPVARGGMPAASPVREADRRMADIMRNTDRMKPD